MKKIDNKKQLMVFTLLIIIFMWCVIFIVQNIVLDKIHRVKGDMLKNIYEESIGSDSNVKNPLSEFTQINNEFIGWLKVGESLLPVVQAKDNVKYLTLDLYEKYDKRGTPFLDYRNNAESLGETMLIYGHNYNYSQEMFYEVEKLKNPEYTNKYPYILFNTIYGEKKYVIVAVFIVDINEDGVFDYNNSFLLNDEENRRDFVENISVRNLLSTNLSFDMEDRLIMLSTCGYDFLTERIVAVGKLVDTEIEEPIYKKNPNPLLPQIWKRLYDK